MNIFPGVSANHLLQTLLGMNLFYFNASTSTMKVGKDFWVFIALALPLTVCTIGFWFFLSHRQEKKRDLQTPKELLERGSIAKV